MFSKSLSKYMAAIIFCSCVLFAGCQKELSGDGSIIAPVLQADLVTKVTVKTVSGFVTNENNVAVNGATVVIGNVSTTTDKFGYFQVANSLVIQNAATVKVTMPGYFNGIKTFIAAEGKSAFFRIKLIPKTVVGNFSSTAGGTVSLTNGMSLAFGASAVVLAGTNTAYSGTVQVAAYWISPTATDLQSIMPGDLRGLDTATILRTLTTYGMAAVEITSPTGQLLQIDSNKVATLTMPIPSAIIANAPASLPLWYFDENIGLWKQQGSAIKTGNTYVGDVKHFSFWNCDVPSNYVQFNCTIVDPSNRPVKSALVKIYVATQPSNARYGYTDSSGYVSGAVPNNASLVMEVYSEPACINFVVSRNFTTTTVNISLGNIVIPIANAALITGTVNNCSGSPVTNGYVIMTKNYSNFYTPVNSDGTFTFNTTLCDVTVPITLVGVDASNLQQSNSLTVTVGTGNNNVGVLAACGTSITQYVNYIINGTSYVIDGLNDEYSQSLYSQSNPFSMYISGTQVNGSGSMANSAYFNFNEPGIAVGSSQLLNSFYTRQINDSANIIAPINVQITEYGSVGQYIAGNFTGILMSSAPLSTVYNISCTFRVRRRQ
jgi:hypothetical protein